MNEYQCFYCGRKMFWYQFNGEFSIIVKCKSCCKMNVVTFCSAVTPTNLILQPLKAD